MPGAAIRELVRESLKDNLCVREAEPSTLKESPLKFLNFEKHLKNLCQTLGLVVLPRMCDRSIVGTIDFIAPEIYDVTWLAILVDLCEFANTKSFACMKDKSIAPELVCTQEKYDTAVDIYAFGMVLLEMIGREQPWSECETHGCTWKIRRTRTYPMRHSCR